MKDKPPDVILLAELESLQHKDTKKNPKLNMATTAALQLLHNHVHKAWPQDETEWDWDDHFEDPSD